MVFGAGARSRVVPDGEFVAPPEAGSYAGRVRFEVLGQLRVIDRS